MNTYLVMCIMYTRIQYDTEYGKVTFNFYNNSTGVFVILHLPLNPLLLVLFIIINYFNI